MPRYLLSTHSAAGTTREPATTFTPARKNGCKQDACVLPGLTERRPPQRWQFSTDVGGSQDERSRHAATAHRTPTAIRITALGTDAGPTMLSLNAAMSTSEPMM